MPQSIYLNFLKNKNKMNKITMSVWIRINFGTHAKLNEELGLGKNTINRWFNSDPKKFYQHLPKLSALGKTPVDQMVEMIEQRIVDVDALRSL